MINTWDFHVPLSKGKPQSERMSHEIFVGTQFLLTTPSPWIASISIMLQLALFWETVPVMIPPDAPMPIQVKVVDQIHKVVELDGGFYPPSLLKDICNDADALSRLTKRKYIVYGGAP